MRPLDPLSGISSVAALLKRAPAAEVRAELDRLDALPLEGAARAARAFARGALALREGALDAARASLGESADAFATFGDRQAAALARAETWLATIRRGPRAVYADAIAALAKIAEDAAGDRLVEVVALHYRGTAERFAGDALATQRTLLEAFAKSDGLLDARAQVLNSLGTLYVVLGAHGAATSMLEHAAELHHQNGDVVGEAIAFGQLGSAALARGEPELARRHLQRQEWLASRVGDAFGRARALVFLADVALELGRPDDAIALATQAREVAASVTPPLSMWIAYASRSIGRAKVELGEASAEEELSAAAALFAKIGNQLGDALVRWDLAHLEAIRGAGRVGDRDPWVSAAWAFGSLGLPARVAQLLADRLALGAGAADASAGVASVITEDALAALASSAPQLGVAQELRLVYGDPERLAAIADRRGAAQRNLARLAALTLAPPGLFVAAIAARAIGGARGAHVGATLPPLRAAAACVAELPGLVVWVWPSMTPIEEVARDLAAVRARLGDDARVALERAPAARVVSPPVAGEPSALVAGLALFALASRAMAAPPASLEVSSAIAWTPDAEGLAKLAGYTVAR